MGIIRITIEEINRRKPSKSRLVAIDFAPSAPIRDNVFRTMVNAICLCGNRVVLRANAIISGHSCSCGCYFKEQVAVRFVRYAHVPHHLRKVYASMLQRCYNPKDRGYKNYGAKGVRVCEEWIKDKGLFFNWALDNGWEKGLQVDKDIIGDGFLYSPTTCSIVTIQDNLAAKKSSAPKLYKYKNQILTLPKICLLENVNHHFVYNKMKIGNASLSEAIKRGKFIKNKERRDYSAKGSNSKNCRPVIQREMNGDFVKKWDYLRKVAEGGFSPVCVCKVCKGKNKHHKNFKWEYAIN